jgi:hypothetical protein
MKTPIKTLKDYGKGKVKEANVLEYANKEDTYRSLTVNFHNVERITTRTETLKSGHRITTFEGETSILGKYEKVQVNFFHK